MKPAPYPADTRAKGWRFELDYEQIEQSSTWALAGPEGQAWLLKLWLLAWRQVPCGSLPAEEDVISALLGMLPKAWAKHRRVLLRGWYGAEDGRMYHPTITARVLEMMERRRKESDRKALARARTAAESRGGDEDSGARPASVPRDNQGTDTGSPAGLHPESGTDHRIPTTLEPPPTPPSPELKI